VDSFEPIEGGVLPGRGRPEPGNTTAGPWLCSRDGGVPAVWAGRGDRGREVLLVRAPIDRFPKPIEKLEGGTELYMALAGEEEAGIRRMEVDDGDRECGAGTGLKKRRRLRGEIMDGLLFPISISPLSLPSTLFLSFSFSLFLSLSPLRLSRYWCGREEARPR
jgi:hypothetical protein